MLDREDHRRAFVDAVPIPSALIWLRSCESWRRVRDSCADAGTIVTVE